MHVIGCFPLWVGGRGLCAASPSEESAMVSRRQVESQRIVATALSLGGNIGPA
ncbi:MAG: hypothetical protein FJ090_17360 [Deltaproteobacteria bacterium]|nr:hypothetical protein [Deltaproteobacteria bacterium]